MIINAGFHLNECTDSAEAARVWAYVVGSNVDAPLGYFLSNRLIEEFKWFGLFNRMIIPRPIKLDSSA